MYELHDDEVNFIHRFCQETNQSFDAAVSYVQEAKEAGMNRTVNRMIRGVEELDNVKVIVGHYFSESLDNIDWANATINVATSLKDNSDEPDMIVVMELEDDESEIWTRNYIWECRLPMTKELRNISYVCEGDYTFYKTATWSNHSGWHGFTNDGDEHLITQEGMLAWDEKIS